MCLSIPLFSFFLLLVISEVRRIDIDRLKGASVYGKRIVDIIYSIDKGYLGKCMCV